MRLAVLAEEEDCEQPDVRAHHDQGKSVRIDHAKAPSGRLATGGHEGGAPCPLNLVRPSCPS
eukprot:6636450-Pyramimonas_sp.AAC.1